ncbi:MAG TPA: hypothetical protein VJM31_13975 [Vicinamibacterales bacterium]|nr:hypothetical protein [Vicinamibacterales bacterium]
MGSGNFGTNESMHWAVSHSDRAGDTTITGRDPIPVELIGEGTDGKGNSAGKGHRGYLRVRLRFTGQGGRKSLADLLAYLSKNAPTDDYELDIRVPAIPRTQEEITKGTKGPWEVRVDW